MRKKDKKNYCQNCRNKRKVQFTLKIAGLKIGLCKNCWIGYAYGLKQDWDMFYQSETEFRQAIERTNKNEKS